MTHSAGATGLLLSGQRRGPPRGDLRTPLLWAAPGAGAQPNAAASLGEQPGLNSASQSDA